MLEYKGQWRSCTGCDLLKGTPYEDWPWTSISHSALWEKYPSVWIAYTVQVAINHTN